ncbi:hypothetical protein ACLBV5_09595 [Brevundimonas sp. M1A4_2e]
MIRAILFATIALTLAGCGTTRTVTETVYVPVTIDQSFFDPALCPWPKKADYIVQGTESEVASYDLAAYASYRCERAGRLGAGQRQREIIRDVEKRSD